MKLSCNGCRVLRKGCSENCIIKPCLEWISSSEAQGHATLFLAKFYGRTGLLNLLANASNQNAQAAFKSLLYEAAGRLVNPTDGALGLFWTGQWSRCEAAVESVLTGSNIKDVIVVDGQTSSDTHIAENHVLPTTSDIRHVARGTNVDIKEKTQFKRAGSIFKPKSRVGLADNATLLKSILENGNVKTVEASSMIEKELDGATETQFKRVGSVFKPKPRVGLADNTTLLKSILENDSVKTIEASSMIEKELDGAIETQFMRASSIFKSKPQVGLADNATLWKSILENGSVKTVEASSMIEKELGGAANTQFKRVGSIFKPKPRVGFADNATLLKSILENGRMKTVEASSIIEKELDGAAKTQFKSVGSIFKPVLQTGFADNATLLKSILKNGSVKSVETSSMIGKELDGAAKTQVNLKLTLGFNCQSSNGKKKI